VLTLIASDYSTKEIAGKLGITFKTVVSHRTHLMSKLGVHTVVGLTKLAIRCKLVAP
jgi:DNA-binding CsgD family transcriptional regulator